MNKYLIFLISCFISLFGFSQSTTITLTFQGEDSVSHNSISLESIYIQNKTAGCDTTIYGSESSLVMNVPLGLPELLLSGTEPLVIMPPAPNPFNGRTIVQILLNVSGKLRLHLSDIQGKEIEVYETDLAIGLHKFEVEASGNRLLLLSASIGNLHKTINLMSTSNGNGDYKITYLGSVRKQLKSGSSSNVFSFRFGEQLLFKSIKSGYYDKIIIDSPTQNSAYTFELTASSPGCGNSFSITHAAGEIAPTDKTVTYGTILTNLTGSEKCWITQNLGADHHATSATDGTEASAGWYWQFNRKQGYMHDGTMRTPNTSWIKPISENSDWISSNDPCALLLGTGWRLPTKSEWQTADATGGWYNYNGPYASALKLHNTGCLDFSTGMLNFRGSWGFYWSGSQYDSNLGWYLVFYSDYCNISSNYKSYGYSIRCLKD
jgi:hypothetical protein